MIRWAGKWPTNTHWFYYIQISLWKKDKLFDRFIRIEWPFKIWFPSVKMRTTSQ